ncbi:MAG: glycosyltransferase family 39 protein [bacterium]|nr:glycosyltransferase family 39 protein [bacterium]
MPMWKSKPLVAVLVSIGLLGAAVRLVGLSRDVVDFVVPGRATTDGTTAFYRFHPDEQVVVQGALDFNDALNPPFTMYGALPLRLLQGTLAVAGWAGMDVTEEDVIYLAGRTVSAALSTLCLAAVWLVAIQVYSAATATLAAFLLALAPTAIQQAHYFTVDSLFCLLCTTALAAIVWSLDRPSWGRAIVTGILIGLSASVRLNALLLVCVLGAAHVLRQWPQSSRAWRTRLMAPALWVAGGAVVVVMIVLQPFLLTSPSRYLQVQGHLDFANVMHVVGGSMLQLYTLQYLYTTPFLYQWTHLLPLSIGWPMAAAAFAGLLHALRGMGWRRAVLLVFIGLYLLSAGPMMVKPVRYFLPIVPALLILAAELLVRLWNAGTRRWLWRGLATLTLAHAVVYGLAYTSVWTTEDSRIQAGRWMAANVPPGARIGVERGAFPMRPMIDATRHEPVSFAFGLLFNARGNLLCRTEIELIERDLGKVDYVAIVDANRLANLAAAPEVMPVLASFYGALQQGRLGYRLAQRFKTYPEVAGLRFDDDGAEYTFIGFDHPAVLIYEREPEPQATAAWSRWRAEIFAASYCADDAISTGVAALNGGDWNRADSLFTAAGTSSSPALAGLLSIISRMRAGQAYEAESDLTVHDLIGFSLVDLGLNDMAVKVLELIARRDDGEGCATAARYVDLAAWMDRRAPSQQAGQIRSLAEAMCPSPGVGSASDGSGSLLLLGSRSNRR